MTWNVRRWDEFSLKKSGSSGHRIPMMALVEKQNADILCFQEFYEPLDSTKSNIRYIRDHLGYPWFFFSRDYHSPTNKYETGAIIFSRHPIVSKMQAHFGKDSLHKSESLIAADIDVDGRIIRVFTTHLQSVLFKTRDFRNVEIIQNAEDSIVEASRSLVKKLKNALGLRGYQADTVRKRLDACPFPMVICGDFNDVPNSYSYFHIRGDLQDAFIAKCFGIGRSYKQISPTLRIDYILPSRDFHIIQSMKLNSPYSDHNAMLTDLQLQEHK
jgi:endonuclease/exonuclease/phosphatase family metal-dependent hydrolase